MFMQNLLYGLGIVLAVFITWNAMRGEWRCYHCGFSTTIETEAQAHFGDDSGEPPLCIYWSKLSRDERLHEFQQLTIELDGERDENYKLRLENEALDDRVNSADNGIRTRFPGCTSLHDVWCKMDSMRGEVLLAREQAASDEFWKRTCSDPDSAEKIRRELREYRQLVETLMEVYPYISGGKLVSLDTTAEGVKKAVDAHYHSTEAKVQKDIPTSYSVPDAYDRWPSTGVLAARAAKVSPKSDNQE